MKPIFKTVLKLAIAAMLIYWLVTSGKLELSQLKIFLTRPEVLILDVGVWFFCAVLLAALRWQALLKGLGIAVAYKRVLQLHLIGLFFNAAMPGAVGGDIIKGVYVIKEQQGARKTSAMLSILLDRVVGLFGIFCLAGLAGVFNFEFLWSHAAMRPLILVVGLGLLGGVVLFSAVLFPFAPESDPFHWLFRKKVPGFAFAGRVYTAMCSYRHAPWSLFAALGLTLVLQTGCMGFCWYLTGVVTDTWPNISAYGVVYAIGIMTTAVPLAPGGLGIGHVAFEKLYALAGWSGGANIFNIYILGQLGLHLLGVFPYLFYRANLDASDKELIEEQVGRAV